MEPRNMTRMVDEDFENYNFNMSIDELLTALADPAIDDYVVPSTTVHSYRGYYDQLALEPSMGTVAELRSELEGAKGVTFTGYKGGDYVMEGYTNVWLASYGNLGEAIVGVEVDHDLKQVIFLLAETRF